MDDMLLPTSVAMRPARWPATEGDYPSNTDSIMIAGFRISRSRIIHNLHNIRIPMIW